MSKKKIIRTISSQLSRAKMGLVLDMSSKRRGFCSFSLTLWLPGAILAQPWIKTMEWKILEVLSLYPFFLEATAEM